MGFPVGVLQGQSCEQDLNAPQFVRLSFSQLAIVTQRHKSNHLCKQLWICECFVFVVKEAFLICLVRHRITKMKLKLVNRLSALAEPSIMKPPSS